MTDSPPAATPGATGRQASSPVEAVGGGGIVVGVDGSLGGLAALRFALMEAQVRRAQVKAVCAWRYPDTYGEPVILPDDYDPEAAARGVLSGAITAVGEQPGVEVSSVVRQGQAALVLLKAAAGADLLVVGSRGHGGFTGLLLGSVSQQCVHHAPCPVVVVPAPRSDHDEALQRTDRSH